MNEPDIKDLLQQLESLLKEKPDYDKLPGGSGYRNGYADGYKLAFARFKECRDRVLKKSKK
ncbi:MAG: hypothetical protein FGM35_04285 [Rhodocyclaceae bacterium]|jgi:hypothetical protein|nr:hypothetical protein [Rhodocyclaceae bacterium]